MHYLRIIDAPCYFGQQQIMPNVVKIAAQINV